MLVLIINPKMVFNKTPGFAARMLLLLLAKEQINCKFSISIVVIPNFVPKIEATYSEYTINKADILTRFLLNRNGRSRARMLFINSRL